MLEPFWTAESTFDFNFVEHKLQLPRATQAT